MARYKESTGMLGDSWDESYDAGGMNPFQSWFAQYLGEDVDIYDPESIAKSLGDKYNVSGLTSSMFTPLSRELVEGAQAKSYDIYKQFKKQPLSSKYESMVDESIGTLNPNKRRRQAINMWKSGVSDINQFVTSRTTQASGEIRDWLSSALRKVFRMKH